MKRLLASILLTGVVLMNACQKETSFETGGDPSEGTLQKDAAGDCAPITVTGAYIEGTALNGNTNQLNLDVDVTTTGSYTIFTDTLNGVYFRGTGVFAATGATAVTLKGFGTPLGAGTFNFNVIYNDDTCSVAVPFLPSTAGGPATFTYVATGGNCSVTSQTGTYTAQTAITTASVTLSVNVTAIGTYNITTTAVNGITFSSGPMAFASTGNQTVVLNATGTPTAAGTNTITVTQGSSTCNFTITVQPASSPAVFTYVSTGGNCSVTNQTGTYTAQTAVTAATVTLSVNVTTIGSYNITTTAVNGITFSSGAQNFTSTGNQTVVLTASGTPTAAGTSTITVTQGSSTCNFTITVQPAPTGAAVFTFVSTGGNCSVTNQAGTYTALTAVTSANTVTLAVNVTTIGTYNITTTAVNGITFSSGPQTFTTTGNQTVVLTASGTPAAAGTSTITVTQGSSTCTFPITVNAALSNDYFPRTTNSNWSYEWDDVANDSAFRRTNSTISAGGNTYNVFMIRFDPSGFDSSGYYRKSGGTYYERLDIGSFIGFDDPQWVEYIFLKDDQAQGHNWKSAAFTGNFTDPGPPPTTQSFSLRFSYTILQKDVTISQTTSTGTVSYNNVIVVEEKYELQVAPGIWQDVTDIVGYGKSYYARGIGLIKYEAFDTNSALDFTQKLRRYVVY
ncbi:MAG TPA: hypothetical protein VF476_15865 [Chitinophagaceae bacterium]